MPADFGQTREQVIAIADAVELSEAVTDPAACLGPTDVIQCEDQVVARKSRELTAGLDDPEARAAALFRFVRDEITYDFTPTLRDRDDWSAVATLARGRGFCQQKAVLFAALARAAGIPTAVGFQRIVDYKLIDTRFETLLPGGVIIFHGFNFLWLAGQWRGADATLDAGLCTRRGYRLCQLTPESLARLPRTDHAGEPHFDILLEMGPFPDMPHAISTLAASMEEGWKRLREVAARTGATM